MLAVDLSIWISGVDQMDSVDLEGLGTDSVNTLENTADLISQWEAELLQEKLQELLHAGTAPDTKTQVWRMNTAVYEHCVAELHITHKSTDITLFLLTRCLLCRTLNSWRAWVVFCRPTEIWVRSFLLSLKSSTPWRPENKKRWKGEWGAQCAICSCTMWNRRRSEFKLKVEQFVTDCMVSILLTI